MQAHEDRIKDMNDQADSLIESGQFDAAAIQVRWVHQSKIVIGKCN